MMVMGGIIGAGIFLNPAIVAQRVSSAPLVLGVWVLGGAIALVGAFCFAELGARRPQAGGGYVYLRDAFGALPAFLYGWTLLLVIATGAIAAVAVTFARYAVDLVGGSAVRVQPVAVGAILFLTGVNYFGVRPGAVVQNLFTVLKLAALTVLVVVGLGWGGGDGVGGIVGGGSQAASAVIGGVAGGAAAAGQPGGGLLTVLAAIGVALIPVLFSYGGWQQTNFVAEEMREPERTLPRALVLGVAGVVVAYVAANAAYLRQLGVEGLAGSLAPAADVMRGAVGEAGASLMGLGIAFSTFGFLNLVILVTPRVYQAMADDGLFFRAAARLHPRYRTPHLALLLQAGWAIVLTLSGTYGELLDYVVFGDWIFFGATAATLFAFRREETGGRGVAPRGPPPYRMPGYPLLPALFVAAAAWVVVSSVASNPANAAVGTVLIGLGVPVFLFWRRRG